MIWSFRAKRAWFYEARRPERLPQPELLRRAVTSLMCYWRRSLIKSIEASLTNKVISKKDADANHPLLAFERLPPSPPSSPLDYNSITGVILKAKREKKFHGLSCADITSPKGPSNFFPLFFIHISQSFSVASRLPEPLIKTSQDPQKSFCLSRSFPPD